MQLTTLYFFCNRPTIGALMGIGTDLSAALARGPVDAPAASVGTETGGSQEGEEPGEQRDLQASELSKAPSAQPGAGQTLACIGWPVPCGLQARQKPAEHQAAGLRSCRHLSCRVIPCCLSPVGDCALSSCGKQHAVVRLAPTAGHPGRHTLIRLTRWDCS